MFEKIWNRHVIAEEEGELLMYVDRAYIHEGSSHAFSQLASRGRKVARPRQVFAFADHYVPTSSRKNGLDSISVPEIRNMVVNLHANATEHGINLFGFDNPNQGILHVVPPELGITQPGMLICGADSHTSTHGAFGSIAFGMGASEIMHVMTTQRIWQRKPKTMRIFLEGNLGFGVSAKDVILSIISKITAQGGVGHVVEYAGDAFKKMSMDERMTVCNMSIEGGAKAGMIAPDETTFAYMEGLPWSPKAALWQEAVSFWQTLPSEENAQFDKEVNLSAADIAPMVSWGTNPEQSLPVTGTVPDPRNIRDSEKRNEYASAIDYMGLTPGMQLRDIKPDRVFIGSCTNSRLEDIRAAAEVAKLGKAKIPAWVVPGSQSVKRAAEKEGLDRILVAAGFEWREPGCSLCTAINGDQLKPGERCASTSNRNFRGRQGTGGRTHLVSPAMAAAAAIKGHFVDVRELLER
jgi:3-isopropylmalate/(R)-2-methylmalate dehydratase large subunit